ncbi:MAG: hypothetical protein IBJ11_00265 [Phycisphaerales bacterium]|nr:hypothetical protein [Phycisphaerales bacterium]
MPGRRSSPAQFRCALLAAAGLLACASGCVREPTRRLTLERPVIDAKPEVLVVDLPRSPRPTLANAPDEAP